eukprot:CAMPEP_0113254118 /NCGR_PEP_ID=MMETSP0008_2-20120614/13537_1 /TAXON_ID=97485 /ORGANISM="Prymnesium parvum" /LENGTH=95 /DNA_ID=CAMNT_0000102327 /DNA_START=38 /DNA_END=325 /DNA_ORIENTATION=- /assembly_acc=CAM_ASM_000153
MTAKYSEIWDKVYKHLPIWMCDKNLECTRPFCCLTHENRTVHSPSHNRATFHVRQEGAVDPSVGAKRVLHEVSKRALNAVDIMIYLRSFRFRSAR